MLRSARDIVRPRERDRFWRIAVSEGLREMEMELGEGRWPVKPGIGALWFVELNCDFLLFIK